jgi:hypothetical protein
MKDETALYFVLLVALIWTTGSFVRLTRHGEYSTTEENAFVSFVSIIAKSERMEMYGRLTRVGRVG